MVTHNGVKLLIPHQRANTRDPSNINPPFRAGRGHRRFITFKSSEEIYVRRVIGWDSN